MATEPERWDRICDLFEAVRALPAERRAAYLDTECGDDPGLRDEVLWLVEARDSAGEGLDSRVGRLVAGAAGALIADGGAEAARGLIGSTIGQYEVRERLGEGGMGVVFRAFDRTLGREVALKFLPPHVAEGDARGRLLEEARAVSALDHPNLAVVHEIGATGSAIAPPWSDRLFIVIAYYPGETLREKIARGPLPIASALDYAEQISAGLERAHEAGIVHRDIKPANVIVTARGEVKVIDFGVASLLGRSGGEAGATPGTLAYMSPEQTRGEPVDARTDIWSLGVVLYEMLTATRPCTSHTDAGAVPPGRDEGTPDVRAVRPEIPRAVRDIVRRCLEEDGSLRYPDAGTLRGDLHAASARLDPVGSPRRRRVAVVGALLGASATAAVLGTMRDPGPAVSVGTADPDVIAVLPLSPAEPDSALERLGRDLAITLGATLDGMGEVRSADALTVLGMVEESGRALARSRAREVAAGVGAGRFLHGALMRTGAGVGVEAELLDVDGGEPLARISVTESSGDVSALTDSVTLSVLRQLWGEDPPPTLPLRRITTRSVPALRAYLEGEQALARHEMQRAVESFERSVAYDSTFWFAYWRSLYPRVFREVTAPPDPALLRAVVEHADEFPLRDRLLVEAWAERSAPRRLERLGSVTSRFGFYGPAWYAYANALVHFGPYVGTTLDEARLAMERAATLNPGFGPAWSHLLYVALSQGDRTAAARALRELERVAGAEGAPQVTRLHLSRFRYEMLATGIPPADSLASTLDWILSTPPSLQSAIATGLVADYLPSRQLPLNAALLARNPGREVEIASRLGNALAWMARGAWDSALVAADRYAGLASEDGLGPRRAYGIAVAGAVLGMLRVEEALRRRPEASAVPGPSPDGAAELAWLDGMLSYVRGDDGGLERALGHLRESPSPDAVVLGESLDAFAIDMEGDRERAVGLLVDRERRTADTMLFLRVRSSVPLLMPLNRLVAARWLRALGRAARAEWLLAWPDAIGGPEEEAWRRAVGTFGFVERGRIAEAAGRLDEARAHYTRFVEIVDRPVAGLRSEREEAEAGLARLGPETGSPAAR